jgi:hypothetical protein
MSFFGVYSIVYGRKKVGLFNLAADFVAGSVRKCARFSIF